MSALLSAETNNTDKVVKYINECRDMDIEILPPDCNVSDWNFTPAGKKSIRFGMGAIKNIGKNAVKAIVEARDKEGRFSSLYHFAESVDWTHVNKRMVDSAVKAGAFDSLEGHRAQLIAALDRAVELGQNATRDRSTGQGGLFTNLANDVSANEDVLPETPVWPEKEKLAGEKEMLGFYVTGHPLNAYREKIDELGSTNSTELDVLEHGTQVALCGVLTAINRKRNREGRPWAIATLEDLKGSVDLLIFSNSYEELSSQLEEDKTVLLRGSLRVEENAAPKVATTEIIPLDNVRITLPRQITVTLRLSNSVDSSSSRAKRLRTLFTSRPGDTDVRLRLMKPQDFMISYDLPDRVHADRNFRRKVEEICGSGSVKVMPV
jgi:DNA polymerase-3 subunit alpha